MIRFPGWLLKRRGCRGLVPDSAQKPRTAEQAAELQLRTLVAYGQAVRRLNLDGERLTGGVTGRLPGPYTAAAVPAMPTTAMMVRVTDKTRRLRIRRPCITASGRKRRRDDVTMARLRSSSPSRSRNGSRVIWIFPQSRIRTGACAGWRARDADVCEVGIIPADVLEGAADLGDVVDRGRRSPDDWRGTSRHRDCVPGSRPDDGATLTLRELAQ